MATDCAMMEVSGTGIEDEGENGDDEIELSLELSIGRSYKKSKPENKKSTDSCIEVGGDDRSLSRSGEPEIFLAGVIGSEVGMDVQSKREIRSLRRQEARKKREEKLKKKGSVDEKTWLEARQLEARVRDREKRENEEFVGANKREKIENFGENCFGNGEIRDLNLGLNTGSSVNPVVPVQFLDQPIIRNGGVYSYWAPAAGNVNRSEEKDSVPADCRSFRPYQGNQNTRHDGGDNGSGGCSSSAVSDYQSSSPQGGGSSSDSGRSNNSSHSKPKQRQQQQTNLIAASARTQLQTEHTASSSAPVLPNQAIPVAKASSTKHVESDPCKPQTETSTNEILSLPQTPCVSATGNGPNGKTVNGFLYRYTKSEVTIVCVCHGTSFSPAGFVEHAGGIDIAHPLKHITVVPTAFG